MANLLIIKATKDSKNGKGISKDFSSCYRETSRSIYLGLGLRFGFLGCFVVFFFHVDFVVQHVFAGFLPHKIFDLIRFRTWFHNYLEHLAQLHGQFLPVFKQILYFLVQC